MPSTISVISPTNAVLVKGNFNKHLSMMTKTPATGPNENPARMAGSSENCISRKLGNIKGRLNLANIYKMKAMPVKTASFVMYAGVIFLPNSFNVSFALIVAS